MLNTSNGRRRESLTDTKVRSWPGDAAFFLKVRGSGWKYTSPQNRRACKYASIVCSLLTLTPRVFSSVMHGGSRIKSSSVHIHSSVS